MFRGNTSWRRQIGTHHSKITDDKLQKLIARSKESDRFPADEKVENVEFLNIPSDLQIELITTISVDFFARIGLSRRAALPLIFLFCIQSNLSGFVAAAETVQPKKPSEGHKKSDKPKQLPSKDQSQKVLKTRDEFGRRKSPVVQKFDQEITPEAARNLENNNKKKSEEAQHKFPQPDVSKAKKTSTVRILSSCGTVPNPKTFQKIGVNGFAEDCNMLGETPAPSADDKEKETLDSHIGHCMMMSSGIKKAINGVSFNKKSSYCPTIIMFSDNMGGGGVHRINEIFKQGRKTNSNLIFSSTIDTRDAQGLPALIKNLYASVDMPFPSRQEWVFSNIPSHFDWRLYQGLAVFSSGRIEGSGDCDLWVSLRTKKNELNLFNLIVHAMPNAMVVSSALNQNEMFPKAPFAAGMLAPSFDPAKNKERLKSLDQSKHWQNIANQLNKVYEDAAEGVCGGTSDTAALITQYSARIMTLCPDLSPLEVKALIYFHTIPHKVMGIRYFGETEQQATADLLNQGPDAVKKIIPQAKDWYTQWYNAGFNNNFSYKDSFSNSNLKPRL